MDHACTTFAVIVPTQSRTASTLNVLDAHQNDSCKKTAWCQIMRWRSITLRLFDKKLNLEGFEEMINCRAAEIESGLDSSAGSVQRQLSQQPAAAEEEKQKQEEGGEGFKESVRDEDAADFASVSEANSIREQAQVGDVVAVSFDTEDVPFGFLVGLVKEIEEEEEEAENEVEEENVAKDMVKVHWYSPHSQTKPNPRGKWTPDMVKPIGKSKKLVPREDTIPRSSIIPVKLKWQTKQGFQEGKGGWIMPTSFRQVEDFVERDLAQLARWQLNEEAPDGGGGGDISDDDLGAVAGEGEGKRRKTTK